MNARTKKINAYICLAALLLTGCQKQESKVIPSTSSAVAPVSLPTPSQTPDLTPPFLSTPTPHPDAHPEGFDFETIVDNKTPVEGLVKERTPEDDLNTVGYGFSIVRVDEISPIECLRKKDDLYYSVHIYEDGAYMYIFYKKQEGQLRVVKVIDRRLEHMAMDYEIAAKERYSFTDIEGEFKTGHITIDGKQILLYYDTPEGNVDDDNYLDHCFIRDIQIEPATADEERENSYKDFVPIIQKEEDWRVGDKIYE